MKKGITLNSKKRKSRNKDVRNQWTGNRDEQEWFNNLRLIKENKKKKSQINNFKYEKGVREITTDPTDI